jgi:serine/threonine-protein kinase
VLDPSIGATFAGYRIEDVIGRGGMGVVYRATDMELDRTVALKLLAPELADDESFRRRFVSESRIAASLDHPHVNPIYRAGEADGTLFLAMRHVPGRDLRARLTESGRIEPGLAARLVGQVASALDAAHAESLVHRDVKPGNVLLGRDDHAYLSDFGLSKRTTDVGVTQTGQLVGTLDYIAPEQIRSGEPVGVAADVYALGCMAFHLLTGAVPFAMPTQEGKLWAHIQEAPPRPSRVVPGLAPEFDAVIARAMRKQPGRRYESAGGLGEAILRAAQAHEAGASHRPRRRAAVAQRAQAARRGPGRSAKRAPSPAPPSASAGHTRGRMLVLALSDPFNVAVLAALVVVGALLGAFALMVPLALVVYAAGVARTYLDPATRGRAAAREHDRAVPDEHAS